MVLTERAEVELPVSFLRQTEQLKERLIIRIRNVMQCTYLQPSENSSSERNCLLVPTKFVHQDFSKIADDEEDILTMPTY